MQPTNQYKRQHYVAQFYLRNFASDQNKKKVWTHTKSNGSDKEEKIRDVGQEHYFYALPQEAIDEYNKDSEKKVDKNVVETDMMGEIDRYSSDFLIPFLEDIKSSDVNRVLSPEEKQSLSLILAYQYLRTPKTRQAILKLNSIPKDKLSMQMESVVQIATLLNEDQKIVEQAIEELLTMDWVIFRNKTDLPFITSDHPIVQAPSNGIGFYYYPLDPSVLIALFDKKYREEHSSQLIVNRVSFVKDKNIVRYCNNLQYEQCVDYIFSHIKFDKNLITQE